MGTKRPRLRRKDIPKDAQRKPTPLELIFKTKEDFEKFAQLPSRILNNETTSEDSWDIATEYQPVFQSITDSLRKNGKLSSEKMGKLFKFSVTTRNNLRDYYVGLMKVSQKTSGRKTFYPFERVRFWRMSMWAAYLLSEAKECAKTDPAFAWANAEGLEKYLGGLSAKKVWSIRQKVGKKFHGSTDYVLIGLERLKKDFLPQEIRSSLGEIV